MRALTYLALSAFTLAACTRTTPSGVNEADAPSNAATTNAGGVNNTAPSLTKAADIVRVSVAPVELRAGGEAVAEVRLHVADGYHINANPATFPYLRATELSVAGDGVVTAGASMYPTAVKQKFSFEVQPLAVYAGEVVIKLPLSAAAAAAKGARTLAGKIRVQPCDHDKCYPPATIEAAIHVNIN